MDHKVRDFLRSMKPTHASYRAAADYSGLASTLIKALTEFILPLLPGRAAEYAVFKPTIVALDCGSEEKDLPHEAIQLVDALSNFAKFLCRQAADTPCEEPTERTLEHIHVDSTGEVDVTQSGDVTTDQQLESAYLNVPQSSGFTSSNTQKHEIIITEIALADLRHVVFNRLPIRMLLFNEEGACIRLVDRPEVYRHISSHIRRNISSLDISLLLDKNKELSKHGQETISQFVSTYAQYAILSHTWTSDIPGEIAFRDWFSKAYDTDSPSYKKLSRFCRVSAVNHGLTLAWMDTLCINKDSSSELDESIRSMYKWYHSAQVCIAYLSETSVLGDMHNDTWFTRGWTLQELIAPQMIKFYGRDWNGLSGSRRERSDKEDHEVLIQILRATTITYKELFTPLKDISISRRMQWASFRRVTREEDTAYSLMGIFSVNISTAYGEGAEHAFIRLVREILSSSEGGRNILEIANWGMKADYSDDPSTIPSRISCLIPVSPRAYAYRYTQRVKWHMSLTPLTLTRVGLHVSVLLMPAWEDVLGSALDENSFIPKGRFYATVTIPETSLSLYGTGVYRVLDSRSFGNARFRSKGKVLTSSRKPAVFAVLNFQQTESKVVIPLLHPCFSIMLDLGECNVESAIRSRAFSRRITSGPTVFQLRECGRVPISYCKVPKSDLEKHGIVFQSMYL